MVPKCPVFSSNDSVSDQLKLNIICAKFNHNFQNGQVH